MPSENPVYSLTLSMTFHSNTIIFNANFFTIEQNAERLPIFFSSISYSSVEGLKSLCSNLKTNNAALINFVYNR